jgi:hypothetical protein
MANIPAVLNLSTVYPIVSPSLQQDNFPKNILHNGAQDLSQRYGSASTIAQTCAVNTRTFLTDRWGIIPNGAGITAQQVTNTPNTRSRYSLQLNGASSVTTVAVEQDIESSDSALRCRRMLTFSAWVYCSGQGSSVTPIFRVRTPSAADDYTTTSVVLSQATTQSVPVGVWTQVVFNFDASTLSNVSNGMRIGLQFPSGSLSSSSYSILVSQCQLESGTSPTSFQGLVRSLELEQCLRYYEKSFNDSQLPAINISSSLLGAISSNNNSGNFGGYLGVSSTFQQPKIKVPVVTFYPTYGTAINQVTGYNTGPVYTTKYIATIGSKSLYIQWNNQIAVSLQFNYTADAEDYNT